MLTWEYEALDSDGAKVKGRLRAETENEALANIIQRQLSPLYVKELKVDSGFFARLSASDIEQLTTELAILLRNGVQLDRALDMMAQSNPNVVAAEMLSNMTEVVRNGQTLHSAFARYPRYFNALYCEMIRIGEESGRLSTTLERLGQNQKFQNDLKGKVNQAMIYPAFILAVCLLSLFAIFNFIVPSMSGLFVNMQDVPAYTAFLIDASDWVRANQLFIVLSVIGFIGLIFYNWSKPWFQNSLYSFARRLPVIKNGLLLSERIRFVSSMQLMLQSGLPLAQALGFSVNVVKDHRIQRQLQRIKEEVSQGRMLSEALSSTEILEPVMMSLIKVGEESGRMEVVFGEISDRTRWRFEQWALKMTAMIEPLLIIVMGGLVGSVVVTMLLSIVSTSDVPI